MLLTVLSRRRSLRCTECRSTLLPGSYKLVNDSGALTCTHHLTRSVLANQNGRPDLSKSPAVVQSARIGHTMTDHTSGSETDLAKTPPPASLTNDLTIDDSDAVTLVTTNQADFLEKEKDVDGSKETEEKQPPSTPPNPFDESDEEGDEEVKEEDTQMPAKDTANGDLPSTPLGHREDVRPVPAPRRVPERTPPPRPAPRVRLPLTANNLAVNGKEYVQNVNDNMHESYIYWSSSSHSVWNHRWTSEAQASSQTKGKIPVSQEVNIFLLNAPFPVCVIPCNHIVTGFLCLNSGPCLVTSCTLAVCLSMPPFVLSPSVTPPCTLLFVPLSSLSSGTHKPKDPPWLALVQSESKKKKAPPPPPPGLATPPNTGSLSSLKGEGSRPSTPPPPANPFEEDDDDDDNGVEEEVPEGSSVPPTVVASHPWYSITRAAESAGAETPPSGGSSSRSASPGSNKSKKRPAPRVPQPPGSNQGELCQNITVLLFFSGLFWLLV